MLFNSFAFALFLPTVIALYWMLRRADRQNVLLLIASYVFYGYWNWKFLSLIIISTIVDYLTAKRIHESDVESRRRMWLLISVFTNLGLLAVFKYFNFFIGSFYDVASSFGFDATPLRLEVVLPVGISFYTFQTMSYTIDVYRGNMEPVDELLPFAVYVSFFPQLVAGPIERAKRLLPQLVGERTFDRKQFIEGLELIFWGLFKKVFVADNLAPVVDRVFSGGDVSALEVVGGVYAFAFQIYGDFSGYSDIARGCAKCMGVELCLNFNFPYIAVSPQEFWRRWHISLSQWLRDYLYFSLGGSRGGTVVTYRNLSLTMLLGGLWHGAAWTYVIWGAYQGLILIVHRVLSDVFKAEWLPRAVKIVIMFQVTCYGWMIFRAESFGQIVDMTHAVFTWQEGGDLSIFAPVLYFAGPLVLAELLGHYAFNAAERVPWLTSAWLRCPVYAVIFYLFAFHGASSQSFIYFQF